MFKKTRFRLVLLNAVVFFIILNAFGGSIYLFMQERLTSQIDDTLRNSAIHLQQEHYHDVFANADHQNRERTVGIVLFDTKGELLIQNPTNTIPAEEHRLSTDLPIGGETIVTLDDTNERVLRTKIRATDIQVTGIHISKMSSDPYLILDLIYNLEPERNMLDHLLYVIEIGAFISVILSVILGLFLANRALIPIQHAWDKQQRFVADASHELRTPLSVMKIQLERLFHHPEHTIEMESKAISVVLHETGRISKLVSDLLTLARSDSNELELDFESFWLDELVEKIVNHFQQIIQLKQIHIKTQIDPKLEILGDKERLHQLLVILLDNAYKYTAEGGQISVVCKRQGKHVDLRISDTGIGIEREDLTRVFDRFYRGDKMRTSKTEGTGLGLSIAQWIVSAHGGSIYIESLIGHGTTVRVNLLLQPKH